MSQFVKGSPVLIDRGAGVRGTVLESRPGQLRCALETGQTVWVPTDQVRGADGATPSFAPGQLSSSFPNPYQSPSARDEAPHQDSTDLKWLLFSFDGRIPRSKYWLGAVISFGTLVVFAVLLGVLGALLSPDDKAEFNPVLIFAVVMGGVLMIFNFWMSLALSVKRWHDRGKSGAWVLIGLIPYIGAVWALIENGFLAGDEGPNQYGPPPV